MRFAAAVVLALAASPVLADDGVWFPLSENSRWTYDRTIKTSTAGVGVTQTGKVVGTCKRSEAVGGETWWVVEWAESGDAADRRLKGTMRLRGSADAVLVLETTGEDAWLPPADFAKKSVKAKVKAHGSEVSCESSVGDEAEIATPAGTYKAVKVMSEVSAAGTVTKETAWYARGIGLVKLSRVVEAGGATVTDELVLAQFLYAGDNAPKKAEPEKEKPLLPAYAGATWTYEHRTVTNAAGFATAKTKETVTCTCRRSEDESWLLEWDGGKGSKFNAKVWLTSDAGTVHIAKASEELFLLPANRPKKNDKVKVRSGDSELTVESTVEGEESVSVPAGTFDAVKVTGEVVAGGASVKRTVWYAKGVGVVKISRTVDAGGAKVADELVLTKLGKD